MNIITRLFKINLVVVIFFLLSSQALAQRAYDQIQWDTLASLPPLQGTDIQMGLAGAFSGVSNQAMVVAGGANFPQALPWEGGIKKYYDDIYVYDWTKSSSGQWLGANFKLPFKVAYGASVSTEKGILCIGGINDEKVLKESFFLVFNRQAKKIDTRSFIPLPEPLQNLSAAAIGNMVYVAGGEDSIHTKNSFYRINIQAVNPQWEKLPGWEGPSVSQAVLVAQADGAGTALYLVGGKHINAEHTPTFVPAVIKFDPVKGKWINRQPVTNKEGLEVNIAAGTGFPLGSNYIVLIGGNTSPLFDRIISLNQTIAADTTDITKSLHKKELDSFLTHHPGFDKKVYLYNTITDVWTQLADLPFALPATLNAFKYGDKMILPSGEIRPGVRSPQIIEGSLRAWANFTFIDYIVLGLYFILMLGIGYWASKRQKTTEDYFKAAERIPAWAAGVSIFGTQLSAITFMAIPAKTYGTDWTYFFLQMSIIMAFPIISRFFIPFYRNLKVTTAYEYLEKRFNYAVRLTGSLLFILLQTARIAIVLLLPSLALTIVTGIPVETCILLMGIITILYTFKGGIEAVIWTDVVQVFILLGGALLCLFLIPIKLDFNSAEIWQRLSDYNKLKIADFSFDFTQPTIWVMLIGGLAINTVTYGSDQTIVQRYMTTKSTKDARRSLRLNAIMTLPAALIFFSIGTMLFLFYSNFPLETNIRLKSQDAIFPWFIVSELPSGLIGLLIAAIFAAAMSTLSSSLNSIATSIITDIYKPWTKPRSDQHFLKLAQVLTLAVGLLGTGLAIWMASQGIASLWDQFNMLLGLFTGNLGGVFLLGIFTKRANGYGAMAGIILSGILQFYLKMYTPLNFLMFAFTGAISCMVFGYIFSLIFSGKNKVIQGLTIYTLKKEG